jgi:hypothetical protein
MHHYATVRRLVPLCSLAVLSLGLASCGQNKDPREKKTFPVRGQVFVNGQPATEARVMLVPPQNDDFTPNPYGRVKDDGSFQLNTYRSNDGAPIGNYVVVVEWRKGKFPGSRERGPDLLGKRYANPRTSPFKVQIVEGSNELPAFQLKTSSNTRSPAAKQVAQNGR